MIVRQFIISGISNIIDMWGERFVWGRVGMFLNDFRGVEREGLERIDGHQDRLV